MSLKKIKSILYKSQSRFQKLLEAYNCWDTNFRALISSAPLTKIPTQAHKLFWAHINIPYIFYPNILHVIGPSQIFRTQVHKLLWALSQILPIITHMLSNLSFYKNTKKHCYHIEPQNYTISIKSPKVLTLRENPKSPNKARNDAASLKLAMMRHF